MHVWGAVPYRIVEDGRRGDFNSERIWVLSHALYLACETHPFFLPLFSIRSARGPPYVLHFKKLRNGGHKDVRMDQDKSKRFL